MPHDPSSSLIEGRTGLWEIVIGLEVHAQVTSQSKLFSGASTAFAGEPNTQVSLVDAAFPGMLPVLNQYCVEQAVKTGLGINATINLISQFDRKNYFYADLPSGYQISQLYHPIVGKGYLDIDLEDGRQKRIHITRLHLEQDAGKSFHDQHPKKSYIDLNRCGVALMEIVSEPDLRSAEETICYLKKLRMILQYLKTCDGNMDEGSMRADINVSVRKPGAEFGTRAEIKNVNSFRFIQQAIDYEAHRQIEILEEGGSIAQETRLYDPTKGETRSMRGKEDAHDYRYFPDPDLLPLVLDKNWIESLQKTLPELPDAKKKRFIDTYALTSYEADVLVAEEALAHFYEDGISFLKNKQTGSKLLATWMMGDFFAALNRENKTIAESPVTSAHLAELVNLINDDTISGKIAKDVFITLWETQKSPSSIVEEKGLLQITDSAAIEEVIKRVLAENMSMVQEYKNGKDKLFGFFVGQVMKHMQGKAKPEMVNDLLKQALRS
ncbi:MAG: Asp-tRNA(Asn)/Glu-tRNA(Gln) amidotransferase subunit GatB [Proteobacteria bacterium]|nr:Asp-tRNA(Asn)/Glu-tRNA(Gln) amidotransferase subunit GatB [Pseudomonadota bacterium]